MCRFLYALKQALQHREALKQINRAGIASIQAIDFETLIQHDHAIVFDFDGVLNSHGEPEPSQDAQQLLKQLGQRANPARLFILSNKANKTRQAFFKHYYPNITFIQAARKKPYPDGLRMIQEQSQLPAHKITLIDDRLLTGALACCIAECQCILITQALTHFKKRPLHEAFFALLRFLERRLF
jgi:predicted HAD superfamily phosphohydrolase YqeG